MPAKKKQSKAAIKIQKCPTGIAGLDDITQGGLPKHRSTLVCGGTGSGKSMLSLEFLINGATTYHEPGLFVAFEETEDEIIQNIASLGYEVVDLINRHQLVIDHIEFDRADTKESGSYNLDGLFIRFANAIEKYKIKRVVLDTLEVLFGTITDETVLRSELQRLFRWFKTKKITVIVTAEQGENSFSRYGLEEYVADCVILLDNRMQNQVSTRRLRVAKYRGSAHGCNEYPFVINDDGFFVAAITSLKLDYKVSNKRISSGVKQLNAMLSGDGFYVGSSILVSGAAGIGKSSLAATFANQTCRSGKRCYYFAFEESFDQIVRNMKSIGIDLNPWVEKGLLGFHAVNPNSTGLETHILDIQRRTEEFNPSVVIVDPISNLKAVGNLDEVQDMLTILIAYFKKRNITVMFTTLTTVDTETDYKSTNVGISSSMDTWIYLRYIDSEGERNRALSILKSRGMAHSNQLREIILSKKGIQLENIYIGEDKVLVGTERLIQASKLKIENAKNQMEQENKKRELEESCKNIEVKIKELQQIYAYRKQDISQLNRQNELINEVFAANQAAIEKSRMAESGIPKLLKSKVKRGGNGKISQNRHNKEK